MLYSEVSVGNSNKPSILLSKDAPGNGRADSAIKKSNYNIIVNDTQRICDFVSGITGQDEWSSSRAIGLERNGELVAGVVYDYYNGANICLHIGAKPGRKSLNREFLWYMFHYPFIELGVKRVTGIVPSTQNDGKVFGEGLRGVKLEATLKDAHPNGDMLVFCLFKENWIKYGIKRDG